MTNEIENKNLPAQGWSTSGGKILIIEDERRFREMLTSIFSSEGFSVISASNGEDGLNIAESEAPDIILLDLILPKKDGFEVLEGLKSKDRLSKIPVIVLTNLDDNHDVQKAISLGAYTYLVKANYTLDEIVEKVKEVVSHESSVVRRSKDL